jgi:hypothetical protein
MRCFHKAYGNFGRGVLYCNFAGQGCYRETIYSLLYAKDNKNLGGVKMSEELISKLLTMAGPLLGALVGGLIASLTAWSVERQRWRHERQEKLLGLRREALTAALEWIEPMRNAETRASFLVMAAIRGDFDHDQFLKEFPYLLGELVKKDLPANQRAVLPDNIYERGHQIVRDMEQLSYLGVQFGQKATVMGKPMAGFRECSNKLETIRQQITELETDLRKAFRQTF